MVDAPPPSAGARIALAHDWLCARRGGELVLERIAALVEAHFRPAGLYVMFDGRVPIGPAVDRLPRTTSFLNPFGRLGLRRWLLPAYPLAVRQLSKRLASDHARAPIDLVISSSSAAIKGLRPPPGVPHLCYCHAPPRYLWSRSADYAQGSVLRGAGLAAFGPALRRWDARTSARVSEFIANSSHTAAEVLRCYGRRARVIHPPVRTDFYTPDPAGAREGFWLIVGALEPYKRVDAAILAAAGARRRLVVVGRGSEERRLRALAARTRADVRFEHAADDARVRDLYRRAAVLIFPQVEDFGIVAAEAQACGLPVAARRAGGALDIITEQTGAFFDDPAPGPISGAAERAARCDSAECRRNAERFSEEAFDAAMLRVIGAVLARCGPVPV